MADSRFSEDDDLDMDLDLDSSWPQKLGGETSLMSAGARAASVAAAYHRLTDSSTLSQGSSAHDVPNSNNHTGDAYGTLIPVDALKNEELLIQNQCDVPYSGVVDGVYMVKPSSDDTEMRAVVPESTASRSFDGATVHEEPDPDDSEVSENGMVAPADKSLTMQNEITEKRNVTTISVPDPDDSEARYYLGNAITAVPMTVTEEDQLQQRKVHVEPDPYDCQGKNAGQTQPDPDDKVEPLLQMPDFMADEPDPDDEIRRIQDPAAMFFNRLNKAIEFLRTGLNPSEAMVVLQTLLKIIR